MARTELEKLSSEELHDRAVELATQRLDAGFFWSLIKALPAAQAATGDVDEAETDIASLRALLADFIHSGEGDLGDALRPLYIDYLEEHERSGN